jgi:hypothetical protein
MPHDAYEAPAGRRVTSGRCVATTGAVAAKKKQAQDHLAMGVPGPAPGRRDVIARLRLAVSLTGAPAVHRGDRDTRHPPQPSTLRLRALPPGRLHLPSLRSGPDLLLARVRPGASARHPESRGPALPAQPPRPAQARRATAALATTAHTKSDASGSTRGARAPDPAARAPVPATRCSTVRRVALRRPARRVTRRAGPVRAARPRHVRRALRPVRPALRATRPLRPAAPPRAGAPAPLTPHPGASP